MAKFTKETRIEDAEYKTYEVWIPVHYYRIYTVTAKDHDDALQQKVESHRYKTGPKCGPSTKKSRVIEIQYK